MRHGLTNALIAIAAGAGVAAAQQASPDPRNDWEVRPGFSLSVDTDGYRFPTAIAFVPQPGPGPKDPLYFVTELRGRVKVVTNDRTVHTFVEGLTAATSRFELPDDFGEHGVAGICLDPSRGYVFVTFAYDDDAGERRNNVVRFQTTPGTFSLEPAGRVDFTEIFAAFPSSHSHQIGPCHVRGDHLYVSVGDGHLSVQSQYPQSVLGKVLRMTVDGQPVRSNPMYSDGDRRNPENLVWAMGLRNPFGLEMIGDRVFVADNGINADRFIELESGGNYGWDGGDRSLTVNALVVFAPAASPVTLEYYPAGSTLFPAEYREKFYLILAGKLMSDGPGQFQERSIVTLDLDLVADRMRGPPELFVRYRGDGAQSPVGMAFGPDGLYFASILPAASGSSAIYRVSHDPANEHAHVIGRSNDPSTLIADRQCRGCHQLAGRGGEAGPALDQPDLTTRLQQRLGSTDYAAQVAAIDSVPLEPYTDYAGARREVMAADGSERVRAWLRYRLLEPRFDSRESAMPNPGLTHAQADALADYLMDAQPTANARRPTASRSLIGRVRQAIPPSRHRFTLLAFMIGAVIGGIASARVLRRKHGA